MRSSHVFVYQLLLVSVVRLQRQQVVLGEQRRVVLPPPPEERQVLPPLVRFEVGQHFVVVRVVVGLAHLLQLELPEAVFRAHPRQVPQATPLVCLDLYISSLATHLVYGYPWTQAAHDCFHCAVGYVLSRPYYGARIPAGNRLYSSALLSL